MFTNSVFGSVVRAIKQERERQDAKWGGPEHDDQHGLGDWLDIIAGYLDRADIEIGNIRPFSDRKVEQIDQGDGPPYSMPRKMGESVWKYRRALEKTAALAVAAIESLDRRLDFTIRGDYRMWFLADTGTGKWVVAARDADEAKEVIFEHTTSHPKWEGVAFEWDKCHQVTPEDSHIFESLDEGVEPPRPVMAAFWDRDYEEFPAILQEWKMER